MINQTLSPHCFVYRAHFGHVELVFAPANGSLGALWLNMDSSSVVQVRDRTLDSCTLIMALDHSSFTLKDRLRFEKFTYPRNRVLVSASILDLDNLMCLIASWPWIIQANKGALHLLGVELGSLITTLGVHGVQIRRLRPSQPPSHWTPACRVGSVSRVVHGREHLLAGLVLAHDWRDGGAHSLVEVQALAANALGGDNLAVVDHL